MSTTLYEKLWQQHVVEEKDGETPLLDRTHRGLPQRGKEFTCGSACFPTQMRNFSSTSSAGILKGPEVLVSKAVVHRKTAAPSVRAAAKARIAMEDHLVGSLASVPTDDRHDLTLAAFTVRFKTDSPQLNEQDRAHQSCGRMHVGGPRGDYHHNGVIHPS